ncbi:MAG: DUF5678 domain-containing protein [Bacteriovoracales bacterium]|nr:DUF5678 domain-containing protein [Bacteriovoracales bacterium]
MADLDKEFQFYRTNKEKFLKNPKYKGKYIVIRDLKVIGVYSTNLEAAMETKKKYEMGTFLVQLVEKDAEVRTYNTLRVSFEDDKVA